MSKSYEQEVVPALLLGLKVVWLNPCQQPRDEPLRVAATRLSAIHTLAAIAQ